MLEALQFDFMRNALIAGVLVSLACGIVLGFKANQVPNFGCWILDFELAAHLKT
jgi:hypothetical protein